MEKSRPVTTLLRLSNTTLKINPALQNTVEMGRELQKKKNKSSIPKQRQKGPSKKKILQNPIIAKHWYGYSLMLRDTF